MARDRLAAMRAQQGGGGGAGGYGGYGGQGQGNNGYGDHSYPTQQTGYGNGGYAQPAADSYAQQQQQPYAQAPGYEQPQQQQGYGGYGQQQPPPAQDGYGGGQAYEMQGIPQQKQSNPNAFFAEIDDIRDTMRQIEQNVNRISELHSRSLNNMDEASSAQAHAQLDQMAEETSRLTNATKNRIRNLDAQTARLPEGGEKNVRKTQIGVQKNAFKELVQKYVRVESEYKSKTRARAERQYRIVNPQATPQEVKAAIEDDNGQQIFSQALLNSNRHGEARGALREVQTRHEELRKIEQTMTELAQLFQEIDTLIVEQGEQIGQIENSAMVAETDMKQGTEHTTKAVTSARKARKKRIICFWIIVAILVIIAIIVVLVVCVQQKSCGNGNRNQPARRALELLTTDHLDIWTRRSMAIDFGVQD